MTQKQPDEAIEDWQEEKIEPTEKRDTHNKEQGVHKPTTPQERKDFFNDY